MKGFDQKFIDELKSKNDIVDVISRYVQLEQRGGAFWGRCPFHHEKTPSFCVNAREQFFYCFGCHKSGDVITFISEIESLDFSDSVKFLAERVKMPLPEVRYDDDKIKEEKKRKERLLSLLKDSAKFYCDNLHKKECPNHAKYVLKRGIDTNTLTMFGIGASLDYHGLVNHLKGLGYTYQEMVDSGAVGKSEKNGEVNYYDALANRLIIPVIDQFGNVIAFCGRIIEDRKDVGKYVNTKETTVFSKGKTLFNLNNLKKFKNEKGLDGVIIVEGHMDVISMVQAGIQNVVASMGTALTKDQARILKRYSDRVYISYDGDFAGQKASIRGLEILKEEGLDVKVVSLPEGMDPDDVVKKLGVEEYRKLLLSAMPLIDFKLDILKKTYDINSVDGKRKYVSGAIKVIRESTSPAEQEDLLKTVRDVTGTTFEALKRELYSLESPKAVKETIPQYNDETGDKTAIAERFILYSYLFRKPYALETDIHTIEFINPTAKEIADYIIKRTDGGETVSFNNLYEEFSEGTEELSKIAGLETNGGKSLDESTYFNDCIKTLALENINVEVSRLMQIASNAKDTETRKQVTMQISKLYEEKKRLI